MLITESYRSRQKVRKFFKAECGDGFTFDRSFRDWLKISRGKTLGDAADEWNRRQARRGGAKGRFPPIISRKITG
jgi:hypothetical protein